MATYQVTGPDGHKYRVTGPDGATDQQVLGQIEAYSKQTPAPTGAAAIPDSGKPMKSDVPAPKEDVGGQYFNKLPGVLNPLARGAVGLGEAGLAAVTGAAAPVVGVARSMMDGKYGTQEGVREAQQTTGYQPRTEYGKAAVQGIDKAASYIPGAEYMPGMAGMAGELGALGRSVPAAARAAGDVTRALPKPSLPPSIAGAGRGLVNTLRGTEAAAARTEATATMRNTLMEQAATEHQAETARLAAKKQELTLQAQQHAATQSAAMGQAHEYESRAAQMQRDIEAQHAQAQRAADAKHAQAIQEAERQHAAAVEQSKSLGEQQTAKLSEATTHEDLRAKTQAELDAIATSGEVPDVAKQGDLVRDAFKGAMSAGEERRTTVTKPLYEAGDSAAIAREKDGARADVSTVVSDAKAMLEKAKNIPDLKVQLEKLIGSVEGVAPKSGVPAPLGKGKVASKVTTPKAPAEPLTIAELRIASQKAKDIGYSGETQGYDGIIRREALNLASKLDAAINKFVPEYEAANTQYRTLSEAMDAQKTRLGKLISGEEGGLKGETYDTVASQKIPDAVFKTREGIDLLTDALAGGVNATGEARLAAEEQVNQMVENWVLRSVRGAEGTYGSKALGKLRVPQTEAALTAVPKVAERVTAKFGAEAAKEAEVAAAAERAKAARGEAGEIAKVRAPIERQVAAGPEKVAPPKVEKPDTSRAEQSMSELAAASKKARSEASTAAGKRAEAEAAVKELGTAPVTSKTLEKINGALSDADALSQMASPKYQKKAFDEYVNTMRDLVKQGVLPKDKFDAALRMVDRAEGMQAKTDRAKKYAWGIAKVLGIAGAADIGIKLVP